MCLMSGRAVLYRPRGRTTVALAPTTPMWSMMGRFSWTSLDLVQYFGNGSGVIGSLLTERKTALA